jgi:hypothetical protein
VNTVESLHSASQSSSRGKKDKVKKAMKSSSIYETDQDVDYEYWSSNHNAHSTLSVSNSLHLKCMNLIHLPEKYHISNLYGDADTCILGQGWEVISFCS